MFQTAASLTRIGEDVFSYAFSYIIVNKKIADNFSSFLASLKCWHSDENCVIMSTFMQRDCIVRFSRVCI